MYLSYSISSLSPRYYTIFSLSYMLLLRHRECVVDCNWAPCSIRERLEARSSYKFALAATGKLTLAEQALAAGRNYVVIKKEGNGAKGKKKAVDLSRIENIEKFLYSEPRQLQRTESFYNMKKGSRQLVSVHMKYMWDRGSSLHMMCDWLVINKLHNTL